MKHAVQILMAIAALSIALPRASFADTAQKRLVITDPGSTAGLPAPYLHRRNGPSYLLQSYVFDTLIGQNQSGALVPALATSWMKSSDGLSYDVSLNKDARWHDGADVTAQDVKFTFDYLQQNPYPFVVSDLVSDVEVLSSDRIRITLTRPAAGFASTMLTTLSILPEHIYAAHPDASAFKSPEAVVGSGPYRFVSYDRAQGRYLLEAVETYYLGTPQFSELAFIRMSPGAAIAAVSKGEADAISILPTRLADKAKAEGLSVLSAVSNHPDRLAFNHDGPFGQVALRHALAHVIDRQQLSDIAYQGNAVPAQLGYLQEGSPWYNGKDIPSYLVDVERAAMLFEAAGWSRQNGVSWGLDGAPVKLRLVSVKNQEKLATVLADQLMGFGLQVDIRLLEPGAISKAVETRDYDLVLTTSSTLGDPSGISRRIFGKSWRSDQYKGDGSLREILKAQDAAKDLETRKALLHQFQVKYAEELPSIMLTNPIWSMAHDGSIDPAFLPNGIAMGAPLAMHESVFLK